MDAGRRCACRNNEKSVTNLQSSSRKPLKIGDIQVANRVFLAPMSGVTDAPFRRLAASLGAGLVVSEMTASDDLAERLIEATISAVKVPVTLKMRLGWDDRSLNAPELARRAEAAGVQLISVHGRTRCQFYNGNADWAAVRAVRDAIGIPLVINGDITSFEKAVAALETSGADAVMVGRGAQGQPWLPGQIGRPSPHRRRTCRDRK